MYVNLPGIFLLFSIGVNLEVFLYLFFSNWSLNYIEKSEI